MKEEKQQLWIILLVVFMSFLGTSIAYPIFPPLFLHPSQGSIIPVTWPDSARSLLLGIALAVYPLGQFVGSPIFGGSSDRYGRKPVLMISLAGSVIGYLLTMLSLKFNLLWVLIASRFITGVMEGNIAIVRAMAAELGSISKYKSLGRINGVAAIGYVMGPLLGGFLSDNHLVSWFSYSFPFLLSTLFAFIAFIFALIKLKERGITTQSDITIWERFNLIKRFRILFKTSAALKYLLICSTIFTFSIDIFYEFGPVYLTGLWAMTPAGIAAYTAILSIALATGSGWLPLFFSRYFSTKRVIASAILIVAIIFGLMILFPAPIFVFILFGLVGLSIATANTNLMVQVSNAADKSIQGEAMGAQLSLRTLGDGIICLIGGWLIISSVMLPIIFCCLIATLSLIVYLVYGS